MSDGNTTPDSDSSRADRPQAAVYEDRSCDLPEEEPRGPSLIVLPRASAAPLQIRVVDEHASTAQFNLDKGLCDQAGLNHGDPIVLAFDPAAPMFIGLSADPGHTVARKTPRLQRGGNRGATWAVALGRTRIQKFFPRISGPRTTTGGTTRIATRPRGWATGRSGSISHTAGPSTS